MEFGDEEGMSGGEGICFETAPFFRMVGGPPNRKNDSPDLAMRIVQL